MLHRHPYIFNLIDQYTTEKHEDKTGRDKGRKRFMGEGRMILNTELIHTNEDIAITLTYHIK